MKKRRVNSIARMHRIIDTALRRGQFRGDEIALIIEPVRLGKRLYVPGPPMLAQFREAVVEEDGLRRRGR